MRTAHNLKPFVYVVLLLAVLSIAATIPTSGTGSASFSDLAGSATDAQIPNDITVNAAAALAANGSNCTGNNFAVGVDASGAGECAQPAFSNLSGAATDAQVPDNVTITALNGKSILTGTAALDFADPTADTCSAAQTITVTGAVAGDAVFLGIPAITISGSQFFRDAWVSSNNTVSVILCEGVATTNNPASGTFTAMVIH